mgnify:CR=1 FL=1
MVGADTRATAGTRPRCDSGSPAGSTLRAATEILLKRGVAFKFLPSLSELTGSNAKHADRGGAGKFITIYPDSDEQFADGCGEVVKHAVIADPELFAELEKTPLTLELLNRDVARVALIIARNIDIKRAVVVADERETNQRKLLNFGHSAGHAVEACEHFELGHGNCVSIGMGIITRAAALHGVCDAALPGRIEELCARHGLKTRCDLDADAVFAEALHDKKRAGDTIDLVIPHGIGRCSIDRTPLSTFHELIAEGLGQKGDASAC